MKSLLFISACGLALTGLSACAPVTPATARVALDCPSDAGDLKLSNLAADKKTCLYTTRDGDQISLRLIPVSGSYEATLQPIEQELQGEIETAQAATDGKTADGKAADGKAADAGGKPAAATATATSASKSAAAKAADEAAQDARAIVHHGKKDSDDDEDDNAKVDVGDSRNGHDDHAHIDLPGIHINADDDKADVNVGGINVNAGENGATVRVTRDVRLRGEAFKPERRGFRSTFILARDDLKDGWKSVGYEAGGPKAGPITVAVFKAHEGHRHDVAEDVKRLVRRNGGV